MPAGVSAYVPLANITVSVAAATITVSSISQSYRDLILVGSPIFTASGSTTFRFNNDSGSNYDAVLMVGNGSTVSSPTNPGTNIQTWNNPQSSSVVMQFVFQVMDYSATDKHKSVLMREDSAVGVTAATAARWASTSAVTTLTIASSNLTFAAGSTFSLYGIAS